MELSDIVVFLKALAHDAGSIMMARRGKVLDIFRKPDRSIVTEVDLAISKMVQERVAAFAPHWGLITEETCQGHCPEQEIGLIVDELDGTHGYVQGRGGFTFQCAFHLGSNLLVAMIHDPLANRYVWAVRGQGVWLEDQGQVQAVQPLQKREWRSLRFANHRHYMTDTLRKMYAMMGVRPDNIIPTGGIGSKVIDFVMGKVDVLVALNRNVKPWDWAPGMLVMEELGYAFSHLTGTPVHLFAEPSVLDFGYIACPKEHWNRFLRELSWITERVVPDHRLLRIFREELIPAGIRGNFSA